MTAIAFKIDPEIANLCRPLTGRERELLKESIWIETCRDALITAEIEGETILLDGHNRFEICNELGRPYRISSAIHVRTREEAINWVIARQLGRRNLNEEERRYLLGKRYNVEKAQGSRTDLTSGQGDQRLGTAAERLARDAGVSEKTVRRAGEFAAAVDFIAETVGAEAACAIRAGKIRLPLSKRAKRSRVAKAKSLCSARPDLEQIKIVVRQIRDLNVIWPSAAVGSFDSMLTEQQRSDLRHHVPDLIGKLQRLADALKRERAP